MRLTVVIVLLISLLPSCATSTKNQHMAGAIALERVSKSVTSIFTDVGDAANLIVGVTALSWEALKSMQPESHQLRTKEEDQQLYGFAPATSQVLIKLNKGQSSLETISAGQQTIINSDYSLSVPPSYNNQADVTYSWKLKKNGKVLVESEPATQTKLAAGHQINQPINIPKGAEPGTYIVETRLESGNAYDVNEVIFVVE